MGIGSNSRLDAMLRIIAKIKGYAFLSNVAIFMMGRELPEYLAANLGYVNNFLLSGACSSKVALWSPILSDLGVAMPVTCQFEKGTGLARRSSLAMRFISYSLRR